MQDGGMAPLPLPQAPPPGMPPEMMPPGMPPEMMPPGMPPGDPNSVDMDQVSQQAMQRGVDPNQLEAMLGQYSQQMGELENAQDYETVINGIRGDQMPLQARYEELAEIVGPEDSQATPESVLALVQPVIQMAGIDQGIGGLAAGEMSSPIEGPMAEGIMSTVNMGAPDMGAPDMGAPEQPLPPMPGVGGPAPVNFNQGGAVHYMQDGGSATELDRMTELYGQEKALFGALLPAGDADARLEDRKREVQGQTLFDVAGAALNWTAGGDLPGRSPGEQLAASFAPVLGNIGVRAGELGDYKDAQAAQGKAMDLAALEAAEAQYTAEGAEDADKDIGDLYVVTVRGTDGNIVSQITRPLTRAKYKELNAAHGERLTISKVLDQSNRAPTKAGNLLLPDGSLVAAMPGSPEYVRYINEDGAVTMGDLNPPSGDFGTYTLTRDITLDGVDYVAGTDANFTLSQLQRIAVDYGNNAWKPYVAPLSDQDYMNKFGMPKAEFLALPEDASRALQGLAVGDRDYFDKFGIASKAEFLRLSREAQHILLGIEPEYRYDEITDEFGKTVLRRTNVRTNEYDDAWEYEAGGAEPEYLQVTWTPPETGVPTVTVVDIHTASGKALIERANAQRIDDPGSAAVQRLPTANITPRNWHLTPREGDTWEQGIYVSNDGITFVDREGSIHKLPTGEGIFLVSTERADQFNRALNQSAEAREKLEAFDAARLGLLTSIDGSAISGQELAGVIDAVNQTRRGTGFGANFYSTLNSYLGTIPGLGKIMNDSFGDTEEAKNWLRAVNILGRSALSEVGDNRSAMAAIDDLDSLFVDPDAWVANPETEGAKISFLFDIVQNEWQRLNSLVSSGVSTNNPATNTIIHNKIWQLEKLLGTQGNGVGGMLGPLADFRNKVSAEQLNAAQDLITRGMETTGDPTP